MHPVCFIIRIISSCLLHISNTLLSPSTATLYTTGRNSCTELIQQRYGVTKHADRNSIAIKTTFNHHQCLNTIRELHITHNTLHTTQHTTYCTTHYTTHYTQHTTHNTQHTTHNTLQTTHNTLHTTHYSLRQEFQI